MSLVETLPKYVPKFDENHAEKIDLNILDLKSRYKNGCICCGNLYYPSKYSSMIAQHFKTKKHLKLCLEPANDDFRKNLECYENITEAFDAKCTEIKHLKKENVKYKNEIDNLIKDVEKYKQLNVKLQNKLLCNTEIKTENLIDL